MFFSTRLELYETPILKYILEKTCLCIEEVRQGILDACPLCLYASYQLHLGNNAAKLCLPKSGGVANEKSKGILGWNEYVKPYQAKSKFWFGVWQAAGRPREGELFILQ